LKTLERAALTAARWSWALLSALTLSCNLNPVPEDPGITFADEDIPGLDGDQKGSDDGNIDVTSPSGAETTVTDPGPTDTPLPSMTVPNEGEAIPTAPGAMEPSGTTPAPTTTAPAGTVAPPTRPENPTEMSSEDEPGPTAPIDGGLDGGVRPSLLTVPDGSLPQRGDAASPDADVDVDGGVP
jgi:hypothetical protein